MKSAMQELIDVLDINETNFISRIDDKITIAYHNVIKNTVASLLEKEKDQIREAYIQGHYDSSLDIYNPSECYYELFKKNQ